MELENLINALIRFLGDFGNLPALITFLAVCVNV